MQGEGGVTEHPGADSRNADVDGFRLHVKAMQGHAGRMLAQEAVAPWGTVAADDLDFSRRLAEALLEGGQQIKQSWIVGMHGAGAMIAEKLIQPRDGVGNIRTALAVDHVDALARMGVEHPQPVLARGWRRRTNSCQGHDQESSSDQRSTCQTNQPYFLALL